MTEALPYSSFTGQSRYPIPSCITPRSYSALFLLYGIDYLSYEHSTEALVSIRLCFDRGIGYACLVQKAIPW